MVLGGRMGDALGAPHTVRRSHRDHHGIAAVRPRHRRPGTDHWTRRTRQRPRRSFRPGSVDRHDHVHGTERLRALGDLGSDRRRRRDDRSVGQRGAKPLDPGLQWGVLPQRPRSGWRCCSQCQRRLTRTQSARTPIVPVRRPTGGVELCTRSGMPTRLGRYSHIGPATRGTFGDGATAIPRPVRNAAVPPLRRSRSPYWTLGRRSATASRVPSA